MSTIKTIIYSNNKIKNKTHLQIRPKTLWINFKNSQSITLKESLLENAYKNWEYSTYKRLNINL